MNFMLQVLQTVSLCSLVVVIVWAADLMLKKKAGYRWRKILWLVLGLRLLLPFPIHLGAIMDSFRGVEIKIDMPKEFLAEGNSYEIMDDEGQIWDWQGNTENADAFWQAAPVSDIQVTQPGQALPEDGGGNSQAAEPVKQENGHHHKITMFQGMIALWVAGAMVLLVIKIFQYRALRKKYLAGTVCCDDSSLLACRDSLCKELGIKKTVPLKLMSKNSSLSQSPMLFGYFRTTLLLPDVGYSSDEAGVILRHELTHYASKDLWYKLLLVVVCELYWFNPVFRLMKNIAFHDMECVCDEKVTGKMAWDARQDYSTVILKFMSRVKKENGFAFTTQFAGPKKSAKKRFENIFSFHNRKIGICLLVFFLTAVAAGTACVSVKVNGDGEEASKPDSIMGTDEVQGETDEAKPGRVLAVDSVLLSENKEALLAGLAEKYPDYTVTEADTSGHYEEEFWEQPPAVIRVGISETLALAEAGMTADITEVLEKRGWLDAMTENARAMVSDGEGRVYGIPAVSPYAYGLTVNVELFREAGLVDGEGMPLIPQTWEELVQAAVQIKETTGQAGLCLIGEDYLGSLHFCSIAWNFGAPSFLGREADGSCSVHLDSEEAIAAMEFIRDLKWKYDVLTENPRNENYNTGYEHLANNTAAMFIGANDSMGMLAAYGMSPEDIAMGAVPAGPGGEQYAVYGGGAYVFSKDVKEEEIELVLDLLEMQGMGPTWNEAAKERVTKGVQDTAAQGICTLPEIPVWNGGERTEYEQEVLAANGNIRQEMFQPYFETVLLPGNARAEEYRYASTIYMALSDVLVQVMTDSDADVAELMKTANEKCQKIIDEE